MLKLTRRYLLCAMIMRLIVKNRLTTLGIIGQTRHFGTPNEQRRMVHLTQKSVIEAKLTAV